MTQVLQTKLTPIRSGLMLKLRQPKPRVQLKQPLLLQKLKLHPKLQRKLLRLLKAKLWMQKLTQIRLQMLQRPRLKR